MQNKKKTTSKEISFEIIDGIMYITYNPCKVNLINAKKITEDRVIYQDGNSYPTIMRSNGPIEISREARVFWTSQTGTFGLTAIAFLYENSLTNRILAFFIIKMHPPLIPTKAFKNKKKAREWLQQYMN
jgi:hypothetical protein